MTEFVLAGLLALAVLALGAALLNATAARRKALRARLREWEGGPSEPGGSAAGTQAVGILGRLGRRLLPGGGSKTLEDQLAQAGFYGKWSAAAFLAVKVLLLIVGVAVSGALVAASGIDLMIKVLVAVATGAVLFFLPNSVIGVLRARRRMQVWRHLPYAIDLMEICVSSGMGLDMAWNVVGDEMRGEGSSLAEEMALTNLEMHLGATRLEATRNMADRTGVEEVSSFATMLVQSERFGTSIAEALETYAASMREERSMQAQEMAEKAAVKMIIPMATLLIPAMLLVILGPGLMLVVKALK